MLLQATPSSTTLQRDVNGMGSSYFVANYIFTPANTSAALRTNAALVALLNPAGDLLAVSWQPRRRPCLLSPGHGCIQGARQAVCRPKHRSIGSQPRC